MYEVIIERIKEWLNSLDLTVEEKKQIKYVMLGSTILAVLLLIMDNLPPSTTLLRNTYGGGSVRQELLVTVGKLWNKEPITITVGERVYTADELEVAREEAWDKTLLTIKSQHEDLDHVSGTLELPKEVEGYPFEIDWKWSPSGALSRDGTISEEYLTEEGLVLELTAIMSYQEEEVSYIQSVRLVEREQTEEEMAMTALLEEVALGDSKGQSNKDYTLPEEVAGMKVSWGKLFEGRGFLVWFLGGIIGILLLFKKKQDMDMQNAQFREQLERDYPEIISTFVLYMGAGMTSKKAWGEIVDHYVEAGKYRPAYDEMQKTYIEMMNGGSETSAYEHFAFRVDVGTYRRFGLLLSQNVKKGTKGLSQILEKEATEAFEVRKRRAKSLGEAAGTKLLMPMFLMLTVVLVIVVVPAFFSMQV